MTVATAQRRFRSVVTILLLSGLSLVSSGVDTVGADSSPVQGHDVTSYASRYGVTPEIAANRLELQLYAGESAAEFVALPSSAGVWLEHEPDFQLVAWFKGHDDRQVAEDIKRRAMLPVVTKYDAVHSLGELTQEATRIAQLLFGTDLAVGVSPIVQTGRIQIDVEDGAGWSIRHEQISQLVGTPKADLVDIVPVPGESKDNTTYGGKKIGSCTTAFTVASVYTGITGALTAGHCGSAQPSGTYWETPSLGFATSWVAEWRDASRDFEWHTVVGTEQPQFWDGYIYRTVTGSLPRTSQTVGMYVCKYGITTGASCGNINSNTFAPTYAGACNGVPCAATWIRAYDLTCSDGDSGGPVFIGQTALGIHKGQQGGVCIYMPIEYISTGGVYLLT